MPDIMPMTAPLVVPASFVCQRAFADDPATSYLYPNPAERQKQHFIFEFVLRLALRGAGAAYVTSPRCEGVAYWEHAGEKQSPPAPSSPAAGLFCH